MDRTEFERLVGEALDGIPEEFARHLDNVTIVVEDEPSDRLLREMGLEPGRDTLYGLFQGLSLAERTEVLAPLPDTITVYAGPLTRDFRGRTAIRRQIRATVVHEIAHFFGLDEQEIRRLGY